METVVPCCFSLTGVPFFVLRNCPSEDLSPPGARGAVSRVCPQPELGGMPSSPRLGRGASSAFSQLEKLAFRPPWLGLSVTNGCGLVSPAEMVSLRPRPCVPGTRPPTHALLALSGHRCILFAELLSTSVSAFVRRVAL